MSGNGSLAWLYLFGAGVCEWGWPLGLKLGMDATGPRWGWLAFALVCMIASGALLLLAQRDIPMGTAYAVWTGIGAVGTALLGVLLFAEPAQIARWLFIGLIVAGVVGLRWTATH